MTYNRDRVFAIATGALCGLVFCAGTALGGYHSITELGILAGAMSVACYLICDLALIVASIIDFKEDGNLLEWASWIVKAFLTIYLLFSGGCIAYVLLEKGTAEVAAKTRTEAAQAAYDDCIGKADTTRARDRCLQLSKNIQEVEASETSKQARQRRSDAGWVGSYISWPLFKYLPGILGAFCLFALGLAAKINAMFEGKPGEPEKPAATKPKDDEEKFVETFSDEKPAGK